MKKTILGLLAALALVAGLSAIAEARTSFNLYLGVPYYDYQVSPDYLYDENHGWYQPDYQQDYQPTYQPAYHTGGGAQRQVCLVTFFRRDQVRAGADINVQRARLLPLRVAQRLDQPGDRNRIFFYGSNRKTRETCRYLAGLNNRDQGNNQELACLVTFFRRDQVSGGADANVERARVLPRRVAESMDGPNDRNRIFVYGSNQKTRDTCRYLAGLNNRDHGNNQELACLVTFFRRDQVSGGADANVERARVLTRRVAESMDGPNDRNRIFVYGSNQKTRETCRYLDGLNNEDQDDNQDEGGNQDPGNNPERVCLVTFFNREQVSGGADADVERARVLPRRVAESMDGPDDRNRIFVYGSNQKTEETCRYLNGINN